MNGEYIRTGGVLQGGEFDFITLRPDAGMAGVSTEGAGASGLGSVF